MTAIAQLLLLVATRILIVWVFNNTGKSVFAAIAFHAVDNAAFVTLPDPGGRWLAFITPGLVALAVIVIVLLGGPGRLAARTPRALR